jgi:hypothetical protein
VKLASYPAPPNLAISQGATTPAPASTSSGGTPAIVQQKFAGAVLTPATTYNVTTAALTTTPTVGNVIIVSVLFGSSGIGYSLVCNTPGWTQVFNDNVAGTGHYETAALFVKVAASGDTGAISLTWTSPYEQGAGYYTRTAEISGASITGITYTGPPTYGGAYMTYTGVTPPAVGSLGFVDYVDNSDSVPTTSGSGGYPATLTPDLAVTSQVNSSQTNSYGFWHQTADAASTTAFTVTFANGAAGFLSPDGYYYFIPPSSSPVSIGALAWSTTTNNMMRWDGFQWLMLNENQTSSNTGIISDTLSTPSLSVYGLNSAVVTGASSITVALGTTPAVNDILTAVLGTYDPTAISITPPSGWTLIQSVTSGSGYSKSAYFQRTATSADVTTHSYTFTLASSSSAARIAIFGVANATVDTTVSSIVGTTNSSGSPIQGTGNAETAATNELLVVFATSTRASGQTAAPSISPPLTSIGSIPFNTDASLTPTVAGWTSAASFTAPTVVIDSVNSATNQSLIGVMTMGFNSIATPDTITGTTTTLAANTLAAGQTYLCKAYGTLTTSTPLAVTAFVSLNGTNIVTNVFTVSSTGGFVAEFIVTILTTGTSGTLSAVAVGAGPRFTTPTLTASFPINTTLSNTLAIGFSY